MYNKFIKRKEIKNMNEMLVLKMNILGGMDCYIRNYCQDEDLIEEWLSCGVPDGCDEDFLKELAEDNADFADICRLFSKLVTRMRKE